MNYVCQGQAYRQTGICMYVCMYVWCGKDSSMYLRCRKRRKKQEGKGREMKEGSPLCTTCAVQNVFSYTALKGGAIEAVLLHGTSAANANIIAKSDFNERFTKRALYGKCVYMTNDTYKACRLAKESPRRYVMCLWLQATCKR